MQHVISFTSLLEDEDMPSFVSVNSKISEFVRKFEDMYPGDTARTIKLFGGTQQAFDELFKNRPILYSTRKVAIGITELDAPAAYAELVALATGAKYSKRISSAGRDGEPPVGYAIPGDSKVVFTQLKLGAKNGEGLEKYEYVAMVNVDDGEKLLATLSGYKSETNAPAARKTNAPSFEKVAGMSNGGFWEKIKNVFKSSDGSVDFGGMSSSEISKFMKLKQRGAIGFDDTGRAKKLEMVKENLVPSFTDFANMYSD